MTDQDDELHGVADERCRRCRYLQDLRRGVHGSRQVRQWPLVV